MPRVIMKETISTICGCVMALLLFIIMTNIKVVRNLLFSKRYIKGTDSYSKLIDFILNMCMLYLTPFLVRPVFEITKPIISIFDASRDSFPFTSTACFAAFILIIPLLLPYIGILLIVCWPAILPYPYSQNYFNSIFNLGIALFIGDMYICVAFQITSTLFFSILFVSIILILTGIKIELNSIKREEEKIELKTGSSALLALLWECILAFIFPQYCLTSIEFITILFVPFAIGFVATLFKVRCELHKHNKIFDLIVLILLYVGLSLLDFQCINLL